MGTPLGVGFFLLFQRNEPVGDSSRNKSFDAKKREEKDEEKIIMATIETFLALNG